MFSWVLVWFAVLGSGIHPTVAGIVVAMFIPARGKYDTDRFVQKVKKLMGGFQCEDQSLLMRCRTSSEKIYPS
ncbi:MAG: Na+/H+ antiporter NhaA [Deltaproteobacteria bacterium]|nr:Na+/H+ antiporter NhaA [Deltaproteobacteria bacterium]